MLNPSTRERAAAVLVEDLGWCWWTQPRATRINDLLFVGGIDSNGAVFAATRNLRDGTVRKTVLAQLESDDHNNPALVVDPARPPLSFYSRHDADDIVRFRVGKRPLDVTAWEPERELEFGGATTYAQAHVLGDELYVFTRAGVTSWWYCRSTDWAQSWEAPSAFLSIETDQETYMPTALLPDGRTLRIAVAGHPKNYEQRPWHEFRVCLVDLATGDVTLPSASGAIANLRSGAGLPLGGADLELVHRSPAGRTLNLFDVSDGDPFEVAFASKVSGDEATLDARYHVARAGSGGWAVEDVAPAGGVFGYIDAGFYVGGIVFPHATPGGRVYLSREDGGSWHLERWDRTAEGSWIAAPVVDPSPTRLVRPWPVRNPLPELEVVALALERYDDSYMETFSHLVGVAA
jgi:hypothetical protein